MNSNDTKDMVQKFISKHCKRMAHVLSTAYPSDLFKTLRKRTKARWNLSTPWPENHEFPHLEVGAIGEDLANEYLKQSKYKVIYRNFSPERGGEIDLICRDQQTLVFVEVKTRVQPLHRPLTAVDAKKLRYLKKGADQYLKMLTPKPQYRFDVVEVTLIPNELPNCNLVKGLKI